MKRKAISGLVEVPDSGHGRLRLFVGGKNIAKELRHLDGEKVSIEVRVIRAAAKREP